MHYLKVSSIHHQQWLTRKMFYFWKMKQDYVNLLKGILLKHVPKQEYIVFLFGSRAGEKYHERSDIDIGIWGANSLSPLVRYQLEEAIEESIIPYFVDIVDFSRVGEEFKTEALKQIELWNCPKNMKAILQA